MLENVFLMILNRSIAAGWLIAAVIVLRLLLKRAPRRIVCFLWILAAVRLLMPFSPVSALSLIPSRDTFRMAEVDDIAPRPSSDNEVADNAPGNPWTVDPGEGNPTQQTLLIHTGFEGLDSAIGDFLEKSQEPVLSEVGEAAAAEEKQRETQSALSPLELLSYIWLAGVIFLLAGSAISYLCLRRKVRVSVEKTSGVKICDGIDTAFILGFLSPKIYLPSTLQEEEKEYVLDHERAHLKSWDHRKKVIGYVLLAVYWINPLVWAGYALFCKDLEIDCDERVVEDKDASYRKAYAMALLSCSVPGRRIAAYPLAFGEVSVKERIKSVLHYQKPAVWFTAVGVVLCGIVLICFLTDPEASANDPGQHMEDQNDSLSTEHWVGIGEGDKKDPVTLIQTVTPEEVKVVPKIVTYDFESACEKGEVRELYGVLPGTGFGTWYIIEIDGVEYYYGRYDHDPDKVELFNYSIVSGDYSLANGLSVGLTKYEVSELYPDMAIVDTENNNLNGVSGHQGWNGITYPSSYAWLVEEWDYGENERYFWEDQFDYIMIADVQQPEDTLPYYLGLMMKDGKVAAITFCYPTAG